MKENRKTILVVDDDERLRDILAGFLEARGYQCRQTPDAESALESLGEETPDLVLMDVRMPGMGGIEGLARMREQRSALPVILLTAYADVRDAVKVMRRGAVDYLEKPVDLHELAAMVAETIGSAASKERADFPPLPEGFAVASEAMRDLIRDADLVAPTDATALLTGESGTGKERVAEFIHMRSRRSKGPFIAVNCAAIPSALVESELFGHVKGAFTGANHDRKGSFEAASGGTLLLDEIGEFPLEVQPKLLRVLENGSFQRVGDSKMLQANVRIIASTNRDLEKETAEGRFREDLYWRLNVFHLHLPPLRERKEEIPVLCRTLLASRLDESVSLSPPVLRLLEAYHWPGNIRELANVIERAAILSSGTIILPEHLPPSLHQPRPDDTGVQPAARVSVNLTTMEEAERRAILAALKHTNGNRTLAAKFLGISRRTLFYRLKKYGSEDPGTELGES